MLWVLYILLALFAVIIAVGTYTFFKACLRKDYIWLDEESLKGSGFERYIDHIRKSDAWLSEHNVQDVWTTSKDGLKLHGLWIPAENPRGTILLAHGYRSSHLVDFGLVFPVYHGLGLNILLPQQRSHRQSEGKYITFGVKESADMLCWLAYHEKNLGGGNVILSGLSMGASTIMYIADRRFPKYVKGIIVDSGFTSPKEIISSVFRSVVRLPSKPFIWVTDLCARLFAGFSLNAKDSRKSLSRCKLPIVMVHGLADTFVPAYMTQEGFDACKSKKTLLMVEGADHATAFIKAPDQYRQIITDFVEEHLEDDA